MRTIRLWSALLLAGFALACSEPLTPTPALPGAIDPSLNVTTSATLDAEITGLIDRLFPTGLQTSLGTRWETVKKDYDAGKVLDAKQRMFELVRWIESKKGHMTDPQTGETATTAAARLVSYMVLYVYQGPSTPAPTYNLGADATFEVVDPAEDDTVTTPAFRAGLNVDPGTFTEPVVVTITQNPNPYPDNCSGPLTTTLCQYPRFYDFSITPKLSAQHPIHIAVCHLHESDPRGPLDVPHGTLHDRLRLAHPLPANPSEWTAGGTQLGSSGNDIEILPRSALADQGSSGVTCGTTVAQGSTAGSRGGLVSMVASALRSAFTPRLLHAVDFGPEHDTFAMSPFNLVDPQSAPDRSITASATGPFPDNPAATMAGHGMTVTYAVANASPRTGGQATATAAPTTATVALSSDATWSPGDVILTPVAMSIPSLVPDASHSAPGFGVTIPAGTSLGSHYLLVSVDTAGGIAEVGTANNVAAIPISIVLPGTGAEVTDLAWAPDGAWNTPALPGISSALYPSFVSAPQGDPAPGALPAAFSGARSWWYGSTATGSYIGTQAAGDPTGSGGTSVQAHAGTLSSPVFTVPASHATTLQFRSWFEIESVDPQGFDLMLVYFEPDQGTPVEIARMNPTVDPDGQPHQPYTSGGFDLPPTWEQRSVSLTQFAGQAGRLHFHFATGDFQYNGFRGWVLDDVTITATPATSAPLASTSPMMSHSTQTNMSLGSSRGFSPPVTFPPRP